MRRTLLGWVALLGAAGMAAEAQAQTPFTNFNDPIFAYYSFYLPRQQAQALQPGPEATIANVTANRQAYAATNRPDLFDPMSPGIGSDSGDFAPNSGLPRRPNAGGGSASRHGGNLSGQGPAGYFNTARRYYPLQRPGFGRNQNLSQARSRGFSAGAFGGGFGLPSPR